MNKDSSFAKNSKEDTHKSEKKCKAFKDISKYFSKEEWAKLGYSDKITYVYMKRNYDTMTGLGLRATLPAFMCPKKRAMKSSGHDADEDQDPKNQDEPRQGPSNVQDRKQVKVTLKKPIKEESDSEPIPVTRGPERAQKELCPPGKASASEGLNECSGPRRGMNSIWAYRLRERKNLVVYEEISDPEEDD
ncbi:protein SSXA1-like [Phoca vitulina]|uniref:protein SSXA1-like n=1 Tax=Phoca vitulina TaxID=9720 RepID=UPI0013962149|nr:protein SSXA1-like [Phoca vitulina]